MVSVVIPVRNESIRIENCLRALASTTYPMDRVEALVVDGESTDSTPDIVARLQPNGMRLRLLSNPRRTRGAALNVGIAAARGEIIICLDARNICPPEYIEMCVKTLIESRADNVGGVIQPIGETPSQETIGLAMSHPFGVGNAPYRLGNRTGKVATVYLGCFLRSVFDRVGLFDERADIGEDSDMNLRIRESGGCVYVDSKIRMPYCVRDTISGLWRLYWRYGIQRVGTLLKHGKLTAPRQAIPGICLLVLAALGGLSLWRQWFLWGFLGLIGLYSSAVVLVSAKLSCDRRRFSLLPRLLLAFPSIHCAYGLGFLWRVMKRPKSDKYLEA